MRSRRWRYIKVQAERCLRVSKTRAGCWRVGSQENNFGGGQAERWNFSGDRGQQRTGLLVTAAGNCCER